MRMEPYSPPNLPRTPRSIERRGSNHQVRTPNAERRTPNPEPQSPEPSSPIQGPEFHPPTLPYVVAELYSEYMDLIRTIDSIDRQILAILQENARTSNAEIARRVGMAPSAILERVRKLEDRGVIEGYTARLSPKALGLGLVAYVFVRADESPGEAEVGEILAEIPEVQEVHHVAGEDCYLVKVRAPDPESLGRMLRERFGSLPAVRSTRTTVVLETVKESSSFPITDLSEMEVTHGG